MSIRLASLPFIIRNLNVYFEEDVCIRVGKGMEIPGAHLTVVEVFDVDSKNRCTFAWKSRSRARDQKEKMVVCAMILKVMASRGTVDSVETRRLSQLLCLCLHLLFT